MITIYNVANYFLHELGQMTAMKLQKLCYYAQAWSLAWDDAPLFEEDFEAWVGGPVCPQLFRTHQGKFVLPADYYQQYATDAFTKDQKETLESVKNFYGSRSPHWLSEATHGEKPWIEARRGVAAGERSHAVITKEAMQSFYQELEYEQQG